MTQVSWTERFLTVVRKILLR
uniref:Uncharacterized protein n=1 Tax=Arundo donax TaxID=35708 RepID=A0A0A9BNN3_ARUDO